MTGIKKLKVSLNFGNEDIPVGEMVLSESKIWFKYDTDFITSGIEISPFKLPLSNRIYTAESYPFDGIFGVFNDSLPDGWGRLLLDRTLISKGISLQEVTPLDRLAYVGGHGMGALVYEPDFSEEADGIKTLELDVIAGHIQQIIEGTSTEIIDELYRLGGSSNGARPKIMVGLQPESEQIIFGTNKLPEDFEYWMVKFPSGSDVSDIANIEFAYYKMATDAGIKMNSCKLLTGNSGRNYFATKRFDRERQKRLHMHSASGLMHDNFRMSTLDYGNLMDCAFRLEKHKNACEKVLRLAAFNVYANNCDDHSKNFAFLMSDSGKWEMSPAYDLTFSLSFNGMHSTMVAGESKYPGKKHLLDLANHFGIENAETIIEQVKKAVSSWNRYAVACSVNPASKKNIDKILSQNLMR